MYTKKYINILINNKKYIRVHNIVVAIIKYYNNHYYINT